MQKEDLQLKLTKCTFNQMEVEYLGLVVKNGEVHMDPTKLNAIPDWGPPKSVKQFDHSLDSATSTKNSSQTSALSPDLSMT